MRNLFTAVTLCACLSLQAQAYGVEDPLNYFQIGVGGFVSSAGEDQDIGIQNLIGNEYTVDDGTDINALVELGYFFNIIHQHRFDLDVGINAFYLFPTHVKGDVIQEHLFKNLSYEYNVANLPIYAEAKVNIKDNSQKYALTLNLGLGANIMMLNNYNETALANNTIPDDAFSDSTNIAFTATAGIGVEFYNVGDLPILELGYRFFYFGSSEFDTNTSQFEDGLSSGTVIANAVVFSINM